MNEFEWLHQTRALRYPHTPMHDLWPGIQAQLELRTKTHHPHAWLPISAAAAIVVLGILLGTATLHAPTALPFGMTLAQAQRWKPADPRLAGAAIEFQTADSEIRLAMQQAPDAAFLQRIRQRTRIQQWCLQRYAQRAL